eukprot:Sspe_Gene.12394::Locus_4225_Transcript_1_1_Confidence_1.000_Length_2157::g.12394::m.12394/K08857/NEK1_4_5; NIMA (never in mitosis gene a)-related kinase 1/4/5
MSCPSPSVKEVRAAIMGECFERLSLMGSAYKKERRLGTGSFGEAWLCWDTRLRRHAVVKICKATLDSQKAEFQAKKEVCIMRTMNHPNIVEFYEAWMEGSSSGGEHLHIAMEYCSAGDIGMHLKKRFKDPQNTAKLAKISNRVWEKCRTTIEGAPSDPLHGKGHYSTVHAAAVAAVEEAYREVVEEEGRVETWSLAELESWLVQIMWGLWYIHRKHIIHRDIKPENIFLSGDGKVIKIGDFGISGLLSHTNAVVNTRAGTPLYMAPEIWGDMYTDRVDVYSVGVMFYELVTLTKAFEGRLPMSSDRWGSYGKQSMAVLRHQITSPYIRVACPPPRQIESSFMELIFTMMRKSFKRRPTVGQVLRSFRLETMAKRVIGVIRMEAVGRDGKDPTLEVTDPRHGNVHNPANNRYTLQGTSKYRCGPKSTMLVMVAKHNLLRIKEYPSFDASIIGYLSEGDIVEDLERKTVRGDDGVETEWIHIGCGWCSAHHNGTALFEPCPEHLLTRGDKYTEAVDAAEGALIETLRRHSSPPRAPSPTPKTKPPVPHYQLPLKRHASHSPTRSKSPPVPVPPCSPVIHNLIRQASKSPTRRAGRSPSPLHRDPSWKKPQVASPKEEVVLPRSPTK